MDLLKRVARKRRVQKGALEAVGAMLLAILGLLSEDPEIIASTSGAAWVIRQVQRAIRDAMQGEPR